MVGPGDPGLYYLRARYYDPETGRFLSQEKAAVIALVRSSSLPRKQVLAQLGLPKSTYYDWCRREFLG